MQTDVGIETIKKFYSLLDLCGDEETAKKSDIRELRKYLEETPVLWKAAGDLEENARSKLLSGPMSPAMRMTTQTGLQEMGKELGIETASPLEKLLISQIITCWLDHSLTEYKYAAISNMSLSIKEKAYYDQRINSSQRRYLRAVESLARVKRLLRPVLPPVQLNIAEKQVNITK